MQLISYVIIPFVGSMFIVLYLFYAMSEIGNRQKYNKWIRFSVTIGYSLFTVGVAYFQNGIVNLILLALMPLIAKKMYGSEKGELLYYYIMIVAIYLADVIGTILVQQAFVYQILNGGSDIIYISVWNLIVRIFEYLVVHMIVLMRRKHDGRKITAKQLATALVLPVFSMINLYTYLYFFQIYITLEMLWLLLFNVFLLLGINIYFTYLIDTISENNRLENELNLYREQGKMQVRFYEKEEEKYEESRKLIHDIRNHITAMEQLYYADNALEAKNYAENIHNMLNHMNQNYYTSEKLLNIILNDKVTTMRYSDIAGDIKVGKINLDFMKDVDVTTIFANILDNAIAAVKETKEEIHSDNDTAYIKLRVNSIRQFISIRMENTSKEPKKLGKTYISTKPGHNGIGLKNIERVVNDYDGDMQCEWRDGIFYTTIMLQIP